MSWIIGESICHRITFYEYRPLREALDKEASTRFVVSAAGCVVPMVVCWFIVRYSFHHMVKNPLFRTWFGNPELHGPRGKSVPHDEVVRDQLCSGMLFGSHLGVFPVDVFFAFLVGALLVCCVQPGETAASGLEIR